MSNFKLIDQTKSSVTGSDLLVAGSIVGSFLFFVIKSQRNKVIVLHKKGKSKTENLAIEAEKNETLSSSGHLPTTRSTLPLKNKLPIKTFLFNPMTMKAFQGKNNAFDLLKESKDMQDFMSLIPKPKQIPIERMLLTENELEELREIANHQKKEREKLLHKTALTEGNIDETEERWSIREYDAQDFDLENVYDDFLESQKRRILQKHERKNSSASRRNFSHTEKPKSSKNPIINSPFASSVLDNDLPDVMINIDGNDLEEESKKTESPSLFDKKASTLEIESPEAKAILKRYEEASKKMTHNPYSSDKNTFVTRKEGEQRVLLVNTLNMNCLMNFRENGDCLVSTKLTFSLKSLNYEEDLFLDYSGKYIVSVNINQKNIQPSEVWFENKIYLPAKYLKEGQNIIQILGMSESFESIENPPNNEEEKFIDPNILKDFHSQIYFNHPERKISKLMPIFDQPGFMANIILGALIPKNYYLITSSIEKLNQPIKEDSKFNSLNCHTAIFNNMEDLMDKRLLLFQMKTDITELGFCLGELIPVYEKENLRFFGSQQNKEKIFDILFPSSEIMQLGICTYKKFLKNLVQKIDVIVLPRMNKPLFSYQGMIFVDEKMILSKENLAEFYFLILREIARQFLFTRMKWFDDAWIFEGLPIYLAYIFFEQIGDFDNITQNLPFTEIITYVTHLKQKSILKEIMNLGHPIYMNIDNNYERTALEKSLLRYKSVYFFRQLYKMRGKKSLADILMKMSHYITNKEFIELIKENIDFTENENMIEDWLLSKNLSEIMIDIHPNPSKNTLIKEFSVVQNENNKENNEIQNFMTLYTDLILLNQSCRKQFSIDIKIDKQKTTYFPELEGKYIPKAIIIDADDYSYFRLKLDEKSFIFFVENLHKIDEAKIRLSLYYSFYFKMLDGKFNQFFFLDIILKNLEKESSYIVLKKILKISHKLLFIGFEKQKEIEYSEKFLYLIIKLIEQGRYPQLLYSFIPSFAIIPHSTSLLESVFNEKHTSLTRYYKIFSQKAKSKLLARILACESIGNEKRDKYIENFIDSIDSYFFKEQLRLLFQAVSPNEEEKEKIWFIFAENVKDLKLKLLKPAMKGFLQPGQYILSEIFAEKYFEELPLIINKHDEQYAYEFTKALFPKNLLHEENLVKINKALLKIDIRNEPKINKFLRFKVEIIKKMRDVLDQTLF